MDEEEERKHKLANYETASLLRAVDDLDLMRDHLDGDGFKPPEMRDDLLRLHQLALRVIGEGSDDPATINAMFDLAVDIEVRMQDLEDALGRMQKVIVALATLAPDE
ncbi:MAG: transposase [Paracoccus denitrificans]|uniref:Transposase n=1 Tax=Paracoccus denitrificans TaxID=266 RepID=A0A533I3V0_PARDE|nr:MAG: transposase [Paracoccus denitrificans]